MPAHSHDWPLISIYTLGTYINRTGLGDLEISDPSLVFYRAGESHENLVGRAGFEQIEIEFDPVWLGMKLPDAPVVRITGGAVIATVLRVGAALVDDRSDIRVRSVLVTLAELLSNPAYPSMPSWAPIVRRRLRSDPDVSVSQLARELGLNASWIGEAYRRSTGEGLRRASARLRVERATTLLRETDQSAAIVAAEAGFCDQSHMIRSFRRILRRTPTEVRSDRTLFRTDR